MTAPVVTRLPDEQPETELERARRVSAPVYVATVVILALLNNPMLEYPLWVRAGAGIVWLLELAGIEFGPVLQ